MTVIVIVIVSVIMIVIMIVIIFLRCDLRANMCNMSNDNSFPTLQEHVSKYSRE